MDENMSLENFVNKIPEFNTLPGNKQTDFLAYFLVTTPKKDFTVAELENCFKSLSMKPYSRLRVYLSEQAKLPKGKYFKQYSGYSLARNAIEEISREIGQEPQKKQVSKQLQDSLKKITDELERGFLEEAITCYAIGANRAAIVLTWILTTHHLQKYIFDKKLSDFNLALSKNPDKKIKRVGNMDDFSDLQESKLIEIARAAKVITNDVQKILNEKLGVRNTAAHPSNVVISPHKTTEFISDLLSNVLLKY